MQLVADARDDVDAPVETFVIGVPGADTFDSSACEYPPYHMRAALSAIAFSGAPDYVPASCDGTMFTQSSLDPTLSCHFDMTQGFTAQQMADAISEVRGDVVGCTYELPEPPNGEATSRAFPRRAKRPGRSSSPFLSSRSGLPEPGPRAVRASSGGGVGMTAAVTAGF